MVDVESGLRGTRLAVKGLERLVFPVVQEYSPKDDREWCLYGYFHRLLPIVRGLDLLFQPSFFQLTVAANRALLEILVDVIHLEHRSPRDVAARIEAWEESAMLKAAEAGAKYLSKMGRRDSALYDTFAAFVEREGEQIRQKRQQYWPPKGRHPGRWTGNNLLLDCRRADKLSSLRLEDFYETQYRQMNWHIHGSGFAGLRGIPVTGIDLIFYYSHMKTVEFALASVGIILDQLGLLRPLEHELLRLASDFADAVEGGARNA